MEFNQQAVVDALAALDELYVRLVADREVLEQKIADVEAKQSKYRKVVNAVIPRASTAGRRRNPRGYNETMILNVIREAEQRGEGLGAMEIRTLTDLSWSSVRQALEKHPELFEKGTDGKWYSRKGNSE